MLKNYFRVAIRNLRINRTYVLLNVCGLGFGIAGALLIFIFLQYHFSTDRHQPDFDRIYKLVLDLHLDEGLEHEQGSSYAMATALARDYAQIEKVGFVGKKSNVTLSAGSGGHVRRFIEKESVAYVDQGYMQIFPLNWLQGHGNDLMTEPFTVVISRKAAQKYFGTEAVLGKTLRLNNVHDLRISGVFEDPVHPTDQNFTVYISLPTLIKLDTSPWTSDFGWTSSKNLTFVKVYEGSSADQIRQSVEKNKASYYDASAKYYEHKLLPLADVHFDERYGGVIREQILWILAGVGFFLVFIACINFINLATAQSFKRMKETGIRKVLGSTRQQLFWQFISETAVITLVSGIFAILLTAVLLPVLNNWTQIHVFHYQLLLQTAVITFWIGTMLTVIMLAGYYPAVTISGFNPISALQGKSNMQGIGGVGLRRSLITVQLMIAQVLVIGTLVLLLQLDFFKNADLGFDKNAIVTIPLPDTSHTNREAFRNDLLQYSDVASVTYQYEAPASAMGFGGSVRFDNHTEWEKFAVRNRFGDEHYIRTYRMPLLAGRSFISRDSLTEFVVNEELMQRLGIRNPQLILGRQLEDGNSGLKGAIVGVVKGFHLRSLQESVEPCIIFAKPDLYKEAAIKLDSRNLAQSIQHLREAWQKNYPDEVFSYDFVNEQIARFYAKEDQLTTLIRMFAMVAILICSLGLYGMVSFMVTQKTKEIGVRKVLGASVIHIVVLFGKEFLVLVSLAFLIAAPVGWYIMQNWLNHFTYRIDLAWWILASGGIITLFITMLTIGYKVIQAALMNPVKSLKMD